MRNFFKGIFTVLICWSLYPLAVFGQREPSIVGLPYFSVGAYVLDTRGTANGLDELGDELIGMMSFGGGYEFFLNDSWSLGAGADLSIGGFEDEYSDLFIDIAYMKINLTGITFNLRPKYTIFETPNGGFFLEGIGKLESFASKAHFTFYDDEEDFSTPASTSGFHFYWGGSIGYHIDFGQSNGGFFSLGIISHDFGKAVNKLDLEQSGYFKNEHLKKRTSLEARLVFYFSFKKKTRRDSNVFNSVFFNRDEQVKRQLNKEKRK